VVILHVSTYSFAPLWFYISVVLSGIINTFSIFDRCVKERHVGELLCFGGSAFEIVLHLFVTI
jgi:hypothetical protein